MSQPNPPEDLSMVAAATRSIDHELHELGIKVSAVSSLVQQVHLVQAEHTERLRRLDTGLGQIDARVDRVDARLGQIDARVEQVDATLAAHTELLQEVLRRLPEPPAS